MSKPNIKAAPTNKSLPVLIEMRPAWRISLMLLVIDVVGEDKGYIDYKKLVVLIWMVIRTKHWPEYQKFLSGGEEIPFISVDTATQKALELAANKSFVKAEDSRVYLLEEGKKIVELILENQLLASESAFLKEYGKKLTSKKVDQIMGKGN